MEWADPGKQGWGRAAIISARMLPFCSLHWCFRSRVLRHQWYVGAPADLIWVISGAVLFPTASTSENVQLNDKKVDFFSPPASQIRHFPDLPHIFRKSYWRNYCISTASGIEAHCHKSRKKVLQKTPVPIAHLWFPMYWNFQLERQTRG